MPEKRAGHKHRDSTPAPEGRAKHHYDKLFWADLEGDLALKDCSMAAQGFWVVRMLPLCARAKRRGWFLHNGASPTLDQLAKWSGQKAEDIDAWIAELGENGVYSRDEEGLIYCRRMHREATKDAPTPTERELVDDAVRTAIDAHSKREERLAKQRARQSRYASRKRNVLTLADAPADVSNSVRLTSADEKLTRQRVSKSVSEVEQAQSVDAEIAAPGSHQPLTINQNIRPVPSSNGSAPPRTPATLTGGVRGIGDLEAANAEATRLAAIKAAKAARKAERREARA